MIKPTTELKKKEPSKKLRDAIYNAVSIFIKTAKSIDKIFSIGREEGFSDTEIGNMIRKEMLAANYDPRTIRRALPPSAKHFEKVREQKAFADILSANEHKNEVHAQYAKEFDSDITLDNTIPVHNEEFVPNVPDVPTKERDQKSVRHISITEQSSNQVTTGQSQQTVRGPEEDNTVFESTRISILPEDNKLLKFEFAIPKDLFWRYVEEHLGQRYNCFWITGVMNQEIRKIISLSMGRNDIPQI